MQSKSDELVVLVADANQEIRLELSEAINASYPNVQILEASNGNEFAAQLAELQIDVVFVDVTLPGTNAAALQNWRNRCGAGHTVVLISDMLAPRWPYVARLVGAYDVLLKPITDVQISRVIKASQIIRKKLRLLIIEPRISTRKLIRQLLKNSHFSFEIVEAENGGAGLRAARLAAIDIVMIDNTLPDMPTLEVACQFNDRHPTAKILLMGTAESVVPTRQLSTFGASGYLRKPFSFADVDRTLHQAFGLWHPYLVKALQAEEARNFKVEILE